MPFSLQLLMENVTKHNEVSSARPMHVTVTVGPDGVTVANPVYPRKTTESSGVGLRYIQRQYGRFGKKMKAVRTDTQYTATVPYIL